MHSIDDWPLLLLLSVGAGAGAWSQRWPPAPRKTWHYFWGALVGVAATPTAVFAYLLTWGITAAGAAGFRGPVDAGAPVDEAALSGSSYVAAGVVAGVFGGAIAAGIQTFAWLLMLRSPSEHRGRWVVVILLTWMALGGLVAAFLSAHGNIMLASSLGIVTSLVALGLARPRRPQ